jgi:predicted Zn-dependent protease
LFQKVGFAFLLICDSINFRSLYDQIMMEQRQAKMKGLRFGAALILSVWIAAWSVSEGAAAQRTEDPTARAQEIGSVDRKKAEKLYRVMTPLLRAMDSPKTAEDVRIGLIDDKEINAANAGGGQFYVTTGLLERADEGQLRGIMAHEIAHDDLGHVAKLQLLGTGLSLGVVLLEQLIPGSSAVTPIAGSLIARGYSRSEELAADKHGVEILRRAGYPKQVMIDALDWVARQSKSGGGGFLSTHPATDERIEALKRLR